MNVMIDLCICMCPVLLQCLNIVFLFYNVIKLEQFASGVGIKEEAIKHLNV